MDHTDWQWARKLDYCCLMLVVGFYFVDPALGIQPSEPNYLTCKVMLSQIAKFPGTFPGTIKAPLDVPSLTESADIVCKGEVVYVYDEGKVQYLVENEPVTFRRMVAVLHVDRIYKGTTSAASIEIEFLQADFPSSLESLNRGEYALVFLMKKNARCQFAHITTSKMLISREPLPTLKGRESPLVRIRKALIQSLDDSNQDVVLAAIEELGKLKSKESVAALRTLVGSQDPIRRGAAIASLLNLGDLTQIETAVRFVQAAPDVPKMETVKSSLHDAIANLKDPALLASLTPLLQNKDTESRYAVVCAMRNMRSESTIPFLISAVDDSDLNVRYQAVMALAEVTRHPEWSASIDVFRQNEAKYINQLKEWWTQKQKK